MEMELALNLVWLGVVATAFVLVPKRRSTLVWFALIAASALLFPIISVSDDFNADRTVNDAAAAILRACAGEVDSPSRRNELRPRAGASCRRASSRF
jgi:hypothetical protein